jgi:hypothetical protein
MNLTNEESLHYAGILKMSYQQKPASRLLNSPLDNAEKLHFILAFAGITGIT